MSNPQQYLDTNADPSPPTVRAGVGTRFSAVFAVAVIGALVITLVSLDRLGTSSRAVPAAPTVVVVDDSHQLLRAWESAGLHGVALVDATRDTTFEWVPMTAIATPSNWPVPNIDLLTEFRAHVARNNINWVAAKADIVRTVDYVIPAPDFEQKVSAGRAAGQRGIAADGKSVTANDEGYLRYLRTTFPTHPAQPAVLNIDASYFVNGTPDGLLALLGDSLSNYRLVTVDRAVDATDLPESARASADAVAAALQGMAAR